MRRSATKLHDAYRIDRCRHEIVGKMVGWGSSATGYCGVFVLRSLHGALLRFAFFFCTWRHIFVQRARDRECMYPLGAQSITDDMEVTAFYVVSYTVKCIVRYTIYLHKLGVLYKHVCVQDAMRCKAYKRCAF